MDIDEDDGFGPALVAEEDKVVVASAQSDSNHSSRALSALLDSIASCLIQIPALQSGSSEPSRQEDLFTLLNECDSHRFVDLGSVLFKAIALGQLHIGAYAADQVLEAFQEFLSSYQFCRDEGMQLLAIDFLDSTIHLWLQPSVSDADFGQHVRSTCSYFVKSLTDGKLRSASIRARLLRFVEHYLEIDPTEAFWRTPFGDSGREKLVSARKFTLPLTRDVDVGVRFEAATVLPNLFNSSTRITDLVTFYLNCHGEANVSGSLEQRITSALLLANFLVVSVTIRKLAYFHLLEATSNHPETSLPHVEEALRLAAFALGLDSLFALWEIYNPAVELHCHMLQEDGEPLPDIPPSLLGYSSRKQNSDMILRRFGAFLVGRGNHHRFLELCRASGKTNEEGYLECLPGSIACLLHNPNEGRPETFVKKVENLLRLAGLEHSVPAYLANAFDAIFAAALSQIVDAENIEGVLEDSERSGPYETFRALALPRYDSTHTQMLLAPRAPCEMILRTFNWLVDNSGSDRMSDDAIAYNVLLSLSTQAGKTLLAIEQTRIIYGISLLVSLYQPAFKNLTVLKSLLHLSTTLMSQPDLVPVVEGFVRWGLDQLPTIIQASYGVAEVLVRIAHLTHSFQSACHPVEAQYAGSRLLVHLESTILKLSEVDGELRSQAREALYLWPRSLSSDLARFRCLEETSRLPSVLVSRISPTQILRTFADLQTPLCLFVFSPHRLDQSRDQHSQIFPCEAVRRRFPHLLIGE